jgi:threonyl-tRNA synthetase
LLSFSLYEGLVRIYGAAFSSKEELKAFIKTSEGVRCHREIGQKQNLFSSPEEGLWIWHPEGEKIRQKFVKMWEEMHVEQNFQLISTPGLTEAQRVQYHAQVGGKTAEIGPLFLVGGKEGMLTPKRGIVDHSVIFCEESQIAQEINSSLQFIVKILNICTFVYEIKEERNLIEFRLFDGLGRQWVGPYIRVEKRPSCVVRSVFGSMERFMALFLEKEPTVENQ